MKIGWAGTPRIDVNLMEECMCLGWIMLGEACEHHTSVTNGKIFVDRMWWTQRGQGGGR